MKEHKLEILPHPPYSPDRLKSMLILTAPRIKNAALGVRFDDLEDLKVAVAKELRSISGSCLAKEIADLPKRECRIRKQGLVL